MRDPGTQADLIATGLCSRISHPHPAGRKAGGQPAEPPEFLIASSRVSLSPVSPVIFVSCFFVSHSRRKAVAAASGLFVTHTFKEQAWHVT
jgi:hypothetical protein